VFTSPLGCRLRRSTFDRRVFRPAVDGDHRHGTHPVRPGLTFHGLRHSHKTWLIADKFPEIAQAQRLGHHLSNRLAEVYSHVAPDIEKRPTQNARTTLAVRPTRPTALPTTGPAARQPNVHPTQPPALRTPPRPGRNDARPQQTIPYRTTNGRKQEASVLPNSSISVHPRDHRRYRLAIINRVKKAPPTRPFT